MKTILINCNTSWGIYNFRSSLITALLDEGNRVVTVAPYDIYVGKLEDLGVRHIALKMNNKGKNPIQDYVLYRKYSKIFSSIKPDQILNYTIKPVVYGGFAARKLNIPYYSFITGLGTGFLRGRVLRLIVETLYRISQDKVQKSYFLNSSDLQTFTESHLVPENSASLLPGEGVDIDQFKKQPMPEGKHVRFLYLGRVLGDKGVREYLLAAKLIKQKYPEVHFSVMGDCQVQNSSAMTEYELKELGMGTIFSYESSTDQPERAIADHHCVVLPSYREGLPRTLLEASAMGRPVIATDVEGCRDVVIDNQTGLLCEVRSVESLIGSIEKIIQMDSKTIRDMGDAGSLFVKENFSDEKVLSIILEDLRLVN